MKIKQRNISTPELSEKGITMLELLVVLFINSIILTSAFTNFKALERPLNSAGELTLGFLRLVKATSISQTESYVIHPTSSGMLRTKVGKNCEVARASSIEDTKLLLKLPAGVNLQSTNWDICINSRGFMDDSITFGIVDKDGKYLTISTFLGGVAKVS